MPHVFDYSNSTEGLNNNLRNVWQDAWYGNTLTNLYWQGPIYQTLTYGSPSYGTETLEYYFPWPGGASLKADDVSPNFFFHANDRFEPASPLLEDSEGTFAFGRRAREGSNRAEENTIFSFENLDQVDMPLDFAQTSFSRQRYRNAKDDLREELDRTMNEGGADFVAGVNAYADVPLDEAGPINIASWTAETAQAPGFQLTYTAPEGTEATVSDIVTNMGEDFSPTIGPTAGFGELQLPIDEPVEFVGTDLDDRFSGLVMRTQDLSVHGGGGDDTVNLREAADYFAPTVRLSGGDGEDSLVMYKSGGTATLEGGAGNDSLRLYLGFDETAATSGTLIGGDGDDELSVSSDPERNMTAELFGGAGDDMLNGDMAGGRLVGGPGDDLLRTGTSGLELSEADTPLEGGSGNDTLMSGTGNDTLEGGAGNDQMDGRDGDDLMIGGPGDDLATVHAGPENAEASVLDGSGIITTLDGQDTIQGVETIEFFYVLPTGRSEQVEMSAEEVFGRFYASEEPVTGTETDDRMEGSETDDVLRGLDGDDGLLGRDGNDSLYGMEGDDNLAASAGDDVVSGGAGNDRLGGGPGNDLLGGDDGADTLGGGDGDDTVQGGEGEDVAAGGAGEDMMSGESGDDVMGASYGEDTVAGGTGNDDLGGGTGRDAIDAGEGADSAGGGEGDDTILGGEGDDFLAGGGRNDLIEGSAGDDIINGGAGFDTMAGGAGADIFVWNAAGAGDVDVVQDFQDGVDQLRLTGVDNAPGTGLQGKLDALGAVDVTASGQQAVELSYGGQLIHLVGMTTQTLDLDDVQFL